MWSLFNDVILEGGGEESGGGHSLICMVSVLLLWYFSEPSPLIAVSAGAYPFNVGVAQGHSGILPYMTPACIW